MGSLRGYLTNLSESFAGQAATAFQDAFERWKGGADQMLDGLNGLGNFLTRAADQIEQLDTQIAAQLAD